MQKLIATAATGHYRSDIDGLRAVAVLAVVAYHAFPTTLPGGFVGVDIFFVISGYLITSMIAADLAAGRFTFREFYARRVRRIFPALIVVLLAVLVAGYFLLLPLELKDAGKHVAGGAFFVSNFVFLEEAGYFDVWAILKPLLHLWSLGVEEQFYLVWPLALVLAARARVSLFIVAAVVLVVSLSICVYLTPRNAHEAFYLPQSRFWELMVGAALALSGIKVRGQAGQWLSAAGAVLIGAGLIFTREHAGFPIPFALLSVAGTVLVIAAGPSTLINRFGLGNPIANWFGRISYPLYLWHWPLISFPAIVLSGMPDRSMRISAVLASVGLAAITYYAVEKPIRREEHLGIKALVLCAVMALVGVVGYAIHAGKLAPNDPVEREFVGAMWPYTSNQRCLDRYPLQGVERYGWWFCSLSKDADPDVMILGSSFANDHYLGIVEHPRFAASIVLSIGACDPAWVEPATDPAGTDRFSPCTPGRLYAQQEMVNKIIAKGTIKLAILDGINRAPSPDYIAALTKRITFLERHGARVIVYTPRVRAGRSLRACFARPLRTAPDSCELPLSAASEVGARFAPLVESLRRTNPEVAYFDMNTFLCQRQSCAFVRDGLPVFRDQYDHLSPYASRALAEVFVRWLADQPGQ